ncbi:MerR family transcriptional regulator [Kribbella sancticallisti]|uniref:MerR family transcriptional regulator n=1 Tax=Kribbella sancticallisti TaxID=460087 RepID=A0ABP4NVE3_9ACTN
MNYSIGELARRSGLAVRTVRYYSDAGLVPPIARTPAGYRRYDLAAVARLELIRTLRELSLDLATIRRVLDREIALSDVAAAHAEALAVQIRTLRLHRAILTAVAARGSNPEELERMHSLAKLSADERRLLVDDFLDTVFADRPELRAARNTLTPELPDDPTPAQLDAWLELTKLLQDETFRTDLRRLTTQYPISGLQADPVAAVQALAAPAVTAGLSPTSPEASPLVAQLLNNFARTVAQADLREAAQRLLSILESARDPRRERYLELLATINGWAPPEHLTPIYDWTIEALRQAS